MGAAVALTLTFVLVEAIAGWTAHSLALLSDAGHNLADAAALGFSWYALWIANKPSHQGMTFGYHRVGVFAALANAVSLVLIAVFIGWEAIVRIREPQPAERGNHRGGCRQDQGARAGAGQRWRNAVHAAGCWQRRWPRRHRRAHGSG